MEKRRKGKARILNSSPCKTRRSPLGSDRTMTSFRTIHCFEEPHVRLRTESRYRLLSFSLYLYPLLFPPFTVRCRGPSHWIRGQCSPHNAGVSRKWRYAEALRRKYAGKSRELAMLIHPMTPIQTPLFT